MPLIGDDPEAAEAALLQAYPGRDPLRDVLTGQISLRKFRVMVDHLPRSHIGKVLKRDLRDGYKGKATA